MAHTARSENAEQDMLATVLANAFADAQENDRLRREDPAAFAAKIQASLQCRHCAMCRVQFKGYGHDAQPILDGKVCDECNFTVVKQRMRAAT